MKSLNIASALLAIQLPIVFAAGTYSITAYNSPECNVNATTVETLSGSTNSTCVAFPGGLSLELTMAGSCARMTAFFSDDCTADDGPSPDHTDIGSPYDAGCQTYALNGGQTSSFNSFQVFC